MNVEACMDWLRRNTREWRPMDFDSAIVFATQLRDECVAREEVAERELELQLTHQLRHKWFELARVYLVECGGGAMESVRSVEEEMEDADWHVLRNALETTYSELSVSDRWARVLRGGASEQQCCCCLFGNGGGGAAKDNGGGADELEFYVARFGGSVSGVTGSGMWIACSACLEEQAEDYDLIHDIVYEECDAFYDYVASIKCQA